MSASTNTNRNSTRSKKWGFVVEIKFSAAGSAQQDSHGAALVGVKRGRSNPPNGATAPGVGGEFTVEKVLEAKANKRGKLVEALVAWSPTWESARNLNEVTTAEAYALLGFK